MQLPNGYSSYSSVFDLMMDQPAIGFQNFEPTGINPFTGEGELKLLDDLQANILSHHRKKYACHIFMKFKDAEQARNWIKGLTITSAKEQLGYQSQLNQESKTTQCFYLSFKGYNFLGVGHFRPYRCSSFKKGVRDEVIVNFDREEKDNFDDYHAMLLIASDELSVLNTQVEEVTIQLRDFAILKNEYGFILRENGKAIDWFGFRDGISGSRYFPDAFSGASLRQTPFRKVPTLKSLLVKDKGGSSSQSAGSYLVFLKLKQDRSAFKSFRQKIIDEISIDQKMAEASMIGRFLNGTPLTLRKRPLNKITDDFDYLEHFRFGSSGSYRSDENGSRCPFFAHIRKSNPRSNANSYPDKSIARRGMAYAKTDMETLDTLMSKKADIRTIIKDEEEVGLLFLSFQSSIETQFEYILQKWLHSNFSSNGRRSGPDILTSRGGTEYSFNPSWNGNDESSIPITKDESLVKYKYGAYFFAPSLSFLRTIDSNVVPVNRFIQHRNLPSEESSAPTIRERFAKTKFNVDSGGMFIPSHFKEQRIFMNGMFLNGFSFNKNES